MHALAIQSSFHATVLYITLIVWIAPEWIGGIFQRPEEGAVTRDRGSHFVLIAAMAAGVFAAFLCANFVPTATIVWQRPLVFRFGIALMLIGVAFRWYAIRVLGKYFTRDVATRADQQVVESGPYRWIRHPSYSGTLITVLGFGLATTNWLALIAAVLGTLIGLGYRVHVEEHALCETLGEPYRDYMRRIRRFIPFVW
ncbi:MAG: methyltransferase family protein [Gammaproteobacteria bacterium]